ncbi:MAG: nucleoside-diphosphate sugar epimerase, partial [Aeromonas veronii]
MSRILIAGASGLIGRELVQQLPAEHELTLLCRKPGKEAHHWLPVNFDDLASVTLSRPVDIAFCA